MSKIIKSSESEIFDAYFGVMGKHLNKEAGMGGLTPEILGAALTGLRAGRSALPDGVSSLPALIRKLVDSGLTTTEEGAELLAKNSDEAAGAVADTAAAGARVAPEVVQQTAGAAANIMESSRRISTESLRIREITRGLSALEGKSADEIAEVYQQLRRRSSALQGQLTTARKVIAATAEESADKTVLIESMKVAEQLLAREVPRLEKALAEMGGELAEARAGLAAARETVAKLTEENKAYVATIVESAEEAARWRKLAEAAEEASPGSPAAQAAIKMADEVEEVGATATESLGRTAPEAVDAAETLAASGVRRSQAATEATIKGGGAVAGTADEAAGATGDAAGAAAKTAPRAGSNRSFAEELILRGLSSSAASAASMGALKLIPFAVIAFTGYQAWKYFFSSSPLIAQERVQEVRILQREAITRLQALRFNEGSVGKSRTDDLIESITASFRSIDGLVSEDITEEQFASIMQDLDNMDNSLKGYLEDKDIIANDLISSVGWAEAIAALEALSDGSSKFKGHVSRIMQDRDNLPQESSGTPSRTPVGSNAPSESEDVSPGHVPQMITIYDQEVDIGHLSRGMRSAAPRMIERVINSAEGLAFVDPDNIWGGWLPKTPVEGSDGEIVQDKSADYLRALKYLYLNRVFDRSDLRKFVRQNLQRVGRRRMSGWKDAVKHYRGNVGTYANQENNEFFTQKFGKPANSNGSSVISCNNGKNLGMQKSADQISKDYFQDAVSGLEDQYAKSYYTGLKSMYDQKPGRTEADFVKLYEVHNETGADLIGAAHPKTIEIAEAMGNGGVVENQIEQHRHNTGVAQSMPSGNFRGKHAWVIQSLVKLADQADETGLKKASDLIDIALEELASI